MVNTKVGLRVRRFFANPFRPENLKVDVTKLSVTYERAMQTHDLLAAAIRHRDPLCTIITKIERWAEDFREEL